MNKTLISITTCNRLSEVKKNILPYLQFCNSNEDFDFVLALDGREDDYIKFCDKYNIPLIYSEKREGVGLSKNRVLKQFSDYNYYFFIDDDVELINEKIFEKCIFVFNQKKINYLSYSVNEKNKFFFDGKNKLVGGFSGGGCFNFYSSIAIKEVGGWHTHFAKYKRYGHTEHSYRVYYKKLNPYPFVSIINIKEYLLLNDPPHVTAINNIEKNDNELIEDEQNMIDEKQDFFPITTLSKFYFNGKDVGLKELSEKLKKGRYSLLTINEKRKAWGNYYLHKYKLKGNIFYFILALFLYPNNNLLKHYLKLKFKNVK